MNYTFDLCCNLLEQVNDFFLLYLFPLDCLFKSFQSVFCFDILCEVASVINCVTIAWDGLVHGFSMALKRSYNITLSPAVTLRILCKRKITTTKSTVRSSFLCFALSMQLFLYHVVPSVLERKNELFVFQPQKVRSKNITD